MTTQPDPAPWTKAQRWYAGGLVVAGVAITGIAFRVIYDTVTQLVRPYMTHWPWSVVVSCEIAFLFLFGVGILLSWRRSPSPVTRGLFMALLITGSVVLNVWAARGNTPDMMAHLVVVLAFFAVLLTGKAAFQMLRGRKIRADRIAIGEWVAHPVRSLELQRWMLTWGEPSRDVAYARYMRLLYAIAIAQADKAVGTGRRWRKKLPVTLRYQIDMGQLPSFPGDDWQAKIADHVESLLHPDRKPARQTVPDPDPEPVRDTGSDRSESQPRNRSRKPTRDQVKKMSGADLAVYVADILGADPLPSRSRVMAEFHIGADKARDALAALVADLAEDEHKVIQLAGRS